MRYEIGIGIRSGEIVWQLGPFPCGEWPDSTIARSYLHHYLEDREVYIADLGYSGPSGTLLSACLLILNENSCLKHQI